MTLRDLLPVRALAEERARNRFAIETAIAQEQTPGRWPAFDEINPDTCAWLIYIEVRILADQSRPDSRDAIARLVAAKVGIECGATAPEFRQTTGSLGGWVLNGGKGVRSVHEFVTRAPHPARGNLPTRGVTLVPALLGVNDPAEALARVAIAVLA